MVRIIELRFLNILPIKNQASIKNVFQIISLILNRYSILKLFKNVYYGFISNPANRSNSWLVG
jgi:hypothetical protein